MCFRAFVFSFIIIIWACRAGTARLHLGVLRLRFSAFSFRCPATEAVSPSRRGRRDGARSMETERKLSGVPEPAEHAPRRTWSSKSHQEIATGQPNQWWWHPVTDFIAGSIAGFAGKIVEYPADTVKVRMQAAGLHKTTYSGPLDCATRLIRSKGVSALYTGLPVPLL